MNITFGTKKGLIGFGIFLLFALVSCDKKSIPFGEEFAESYTDIIVIDSLTPVLSTYKVDSFTTSGSGNILLGSYNDPIFGKIQNKSFFQIGLPAYEIANDAIFDSITFLITPTKQYYGDTTVPQLITVKELNQTIELPEGKFQFYNKASFTTGATLGSRTILPRPSRTDSVEIRLNDSKGNELFSKLKDKSTEVADQASFLRYFKGIALESSPSSASTMAFNAGDTAVKMRIYYREKGVVLINKHIDFRITNPNLQFNQTIIDRSGTPLAALPNGYPEVPSAQLGNAAYVQAATGVVGKIMFPGLQNLLNIDKAGKILRAELTIKPLPGSFTDPYLLPSQLTLALTDKTNITGQTVTGSVLFTDVLYGEKTGYTFDITSFLQQQIRINKDNQNGLLIYSPSGAAFNRLVIGDEKSGKSRIQVKIYYVVVK